jgi:hypothetical protein
MSISDQGSPEFAFIAYLAGLAAALCPSTIGNFSVIVR